MNLFFSISQIIQQVIFLKEISYLELSELSTQMKCENWLTKHFKIDIFITNKEENEQIEITKDIKQILDEL